MKTRNLVVLLIGIMLVSGLVAEENYTQMQERIDQLEAKLEKINVEEINNNPYTSGETFNWGTGWFGSAKTGTDYSMNFELGYMLKIKKPFASLTREYVGNRNDYRIGFSAGAQYFENAVVYQNDTNFYKSSGCGIYGKLNFGSPVLLNFVSFSWHLKAMYTDPDKNNDHNITEARMVYGYGNDVEFWLTQNSCVTLGFTDERDTFFDEHKDDSIYPSKIRFVFGFKTFF